MKHLLPILIWSMIFYRNNDWIMRFSFEIAFHSVRSNGFYHIFEINWFTETSSFESMSDNGFLPIIMNINFNTFNSIFKIFQVSFYFTITWKLITGEISIVRAITEIIFQWMIELYFNISADIIKTTIIKESAKIKKT